MITEEKRSEILLDQWPGDVLELPRLFLFGAGGVGVETLFVLLLVPLCLTTCAWEKLPEDDVLRGNSGDVVTSS